MPQNVTEILQPMQQILNDHRQDNKRFIKAELNTLIAETEKIKNVMYNSLKAKLSFPYG